MIIDSAFKNNTLGCVVIRFTIVQFVIVSLFADTDINDVDRFSD